MKKSNRAGLHGDSSVLFVKPIVKEAELTCLLAVDNAVGGDEAIGQSGFAVVHMSDDGDVSDIAGGAEETLDEFIASVLANHSNTFINFTNQTLSYSKLQKGKLLDYGCLL